MTGSVAGQAEAFPDLVRKASRSAGGVAGPGADAEVRARAMRIGNDRKTAFGRMPVGVPAPGSSSVNAVQGGLPGRGRRSR